jgi:DNA-binding response OmpR family regulator
MKQRILVVAEDAPVRATIARWLMAAGYAVELAESPKRAREVIENETVALGIVAPQRLGAEGRDLARELRGSIGRLIVVTEPSAEAGSESAEAIESDGAISKPLNEAEVLEKVRRALPNQPKEEAPADIRHFGPYILDAGARQCRTQDGQDVPLTRGEFAMLLEFARQNGRVVSRDELRQAVAGRDAGPDDRSVDVLISRLRRKIEPDPKQPRIIVTVPGEGYRLVDAQPQDRLAPDRLVPATLPPALPSVASDQAVTEMGARDRRRAPWIRLAVLAGFGSVALVGIGSIVIALWFSGLGTRGPSLPVVGKFDASVVPLVNDVARSELTGYRSQPDFKALAISADGYGMAIGAHDASSAQAEALERCKARSRAIRYCRLYAVGTDVVWSIKTLPLPLRFDIHSEPLEETFQPAALPLSPEQMEGIPKTYMNHQDHRALALQWTAEGIGRFYNTFNTPRALAAVRLAIEGCADAFLAPCLLLSVDGFWTIQVPKSRRIVGLFMLTTEAAMSAEDKQRIGPIYQQGDWRAMARGKTGRWYPIAGAPSESAAVEQSLQRCAEQDSECRIHAISNFRVADDK